MESELLLNMLLNPSLRSGVLKHEMKALLPRDMCATYWHGRQVVCCSSTEDFCPLQMM